MSTPETSHLALEEDWVIQSPRTPAQLIVLLHGAAGTPADMQALGEALAAVFTQALILALPAPIQAHDHRRSWLLPSEDQDRYDIAQVQGLVERLCARIEALQHVHGLDPQATALLGFGQGATLVLHSTMQPTPPAERVVALSGAFAQPLASLRYGGTIHLLHGKNDDHTHWKTVVEDAYVLRDSGVDMTAEVVPLIGHELHADLIAKTVERLSTHIAQHLFDEARASAPPDSPGQAH
jgi:phospholipase/carboxylesterase